MSAPHVSVVTPVHNGEPYLAECIDSVLAQTYPHWDLTIVNNGSKDRSLEIAREYATRDERIRLLDNEVFLEQIPNINRAVEQIAPYSRYCKILLADDWMFPRCLEAMVAVAEAYPGVGIVGAYRLDDTKVNCDGLPYPSPVSDGRAICRRSLVEDFYVFGSPTTLLFRSDVARARRPFYAVDGLHEDTEACYEILEHHDFGFVHEVLTFTRRQNESLTSARKVFDHQHRLDRLIVTMKYGPRFLEPDEFAACRERSLGFYYRFLGERLLWATDGRFWDYHRAGLASVGLGMDRGRLAWAIAGAAWRQLQDPAAVARRIGKVAVRTVGRAFGVDGARSDADGRGR